MVIASPYKRIPVRVVSSGFARLRVRARVTPRWSILRKNRVSPKAMLIRMAVQEESTTQNGAVSRAFPSPAAIAVRIRSVPPPVERMALILAGLSR
jgi:hypothetical protein